MSKNLFVIIFCLFIAFVLVSCSDSKDYVVLTLKGAYTSSEEYASLYNGTTGTSVGSIEIKDVKGKTLGEIVDCGNYFIGYTTNTDNLIQIKSNKDYIIYSNTEDFSEYNFLNPAITDKTDINKSRTIYVGAVSV